MWNTGDTWGPMSALVKMASIQCKTLKKKFLPWLPVCNWAKYRELYSQMENNLHVLFQNKTFQPVTQNAFLRIQKLHCDIWLKQCSFYFHPRNEQTFREEDSIIPSQHSKIISVPRARSLWKPHCFKKHFCPQPCSLLTNLQSSDDHKESRIQKIYYNFH